MYEHVLSVNDANQANMDINALCNTILNKWNLSCDVSNMMTAMQILESIMKRDSLEPWLLSKKEIRDVIESISTR